MRPLFFTIPGIAILIFSFWLFRFHLSSFVVYLSTRFGRRRRDFQLLSSLRENLIHEKKKKMAGLSMFLSAWEKGEEVRVRYKEFEDLLTQLKELVRGEKRNLMAVTRDIFLWGKLWSMLRRIEKTSKQKREKSDVAKLRKELARFQDLIDKAIEDATQKFSFFLNEVVKESVKIVRVEKSQISEIEIKEQLEDVGNTIRIPYDKFKEWQRVLTNLIRNAFEAVEAKQSGVGA